MYDLLSVAKLIACLRYLGVSPNMETFPQRKKAQKLAYLLEVFGINIGFRFNWYLHGPYSSDLTQVLYDAKRAKSSVPELQLNINEQDKRKMENLKRFLGQDINSAETLELLVSLHYLLEATRRENVLDEEALIILKERKPFFNDNEIQHCYSKVKQLLNEYAA